MYVLFNCLRAGGYAAVGCTPQCMWGVRPNALQWIPLGSFDYEHNVHGAQAARTGNRFQSTALTVFHRPVSLQKAYDSVDRTLS